MNSCCSIDTTASSHPCPQCEVGGPIVGWQPVQPHRETVSTGAWQFCSTEGCPVVYYFKDDSEVEVAVVLTSELRTQVAGKGSNRPTPVCFCFSHTREDLAADLVAHAGTSTIKAEIKPAVAEGFCACEHLNPSSQCCLADIHRSLKQLSTESAKQPLTK